MLVPYRGLPTFEVFKPYVIHLYNRFWTATSQILLVWSAIFMWQSKNRTRVTQNKAQW